jgi:peroxiredoxin
VWVVSPDPADDLNTMREKSGIRFPMLMDPDLATIKRYGILNEKEGNIPHPTALIIDREGIVRYRRLDADYTVRPSNDELLKALQGLAGGERQPGSGAEAKPPASDR